jgi:AraC-like DNA-binding protein
MREEDRKTLVALRRAKDQIDRDYAEPLDVPTLAQTAFMSPAHFARQFKQAFGESPYSLLHSCSAVSQPS